MSHPLVTIITPTKNRLLLLQEAMDSVKVQTFPNWEHLIIDDGSDDGSQEMVEQIATKDPRVHLIRRQGEKAGANICRNLGIKESRGEFIVFLDSDDLLSPFCLEKRVQFMCRNQDLDFVVWQTFVFENQPGDLGRKLNEETIGDDLLKLLFFENPWIITGPMWRSKTIRYLEGFDESMPSWQDVDLHLRAICSSLNYLRLPEADHHVRWSPEPLRTSNLQRKSPEHLKAAIPILDKFERTVRNGPGLDWSRQRALCALYFFVAERWVDLGDLGHALQAWKCARSKHILPNSTHLAGVALLGLKRATRDSELVRRLISKWIGFARMRTNPALLK
jgi:glycosyltransferase involved in cell wall biosynthesis